MIDTLIEWAHHTLNFWWGCAKVSPACANCYAEKLAALWRKALVGWGVGGMRWIRENAAADAVKLNEISRKTGVAQRVFVNSMSDIFEDHPALVEPRGAALAQMERLAETIWMFLTKRPENVLEMVPAHWRKKWPAHIWIGTTVEDQERADERIPFLMAIPADVRFLSCEPLLGPVDIPFSRLTSLACPVCDSRDVMIFGAGSPVSWTCMSCHRSDEGAPQRVPGLLWVICGGESGPAARAMSPGWARHLRDQCQAAGVAFFFKQWGEWTANHVGGGAAGITASAPAMIRVGKHHAGRKLDGREWNEVPGETVSLPKSSLSRPIRRRKAKAR